MILVSSSSDSDTGSMRNEMTASDDRPDASDTINLADSMPQTQPEFLLIECFDTQINMGASTISGENGRMKRIQFSDSTCNT